MAMETAFGGAAPRRPALSRMIVAAMIGNVLEWFDFVVYGFFAVTIAEVFFPAHDPTVSMLITFGAFGLAYFVRPLGAIVVGSYTDRAGPQSRPVAVDFADDDRHVADGDDTRLRDDRHRRADPDHPRAAAAGVFGWRRVWQCGQLSRRTCRRPARLQRQLGIRHRRHDHGAGLAVRRYV